MRAAGPQACSRLISAPDSQTFTQARQPVQSSGRSTTACRCGPIETAPSTPPGHTEAHFQQASHCLRSSWTWSVPVLCR